MRICSFLPSATEIIYALGLEDELYGVTHECDYPLDAKNKEKLTSSNIPPNLSSKEIDDQVRNYLQKGKSIYSLDYEALERARPDVIFTQELCEVCAVSFGEISRAASSLPRKPKVISLDTFTLKDILDSILGVGSECSRSKEASEFVFGLEQRIEKATLLAGKEYREIKTKVLFLEWVEPLMSGGHWMAELIGRAGGKDGFALHGKNSRVIEWKSVKEFAPDLVVVAPCGYNTERAESEAASLKKLDGWSDLPAVKNNQIYASDGNAYFSRPGPRIVKGLEILTKILNPKVLDYTFGESDYKRISI
ncbi:MAG: cobalamin-binding protein [Nitrososphaerales archaeon]